MKNTLWLYKDSYQIEKRENSRLIQQVIDSSSVFSYEKLLLAFQKMIAVFDKVLHGEDSD